MRLPCKVTSHLINIQQDIFENVSGYRWNIYARGVTLGAT